MRTYLAYFRIAFLNEIQYRTAAIAGALTQFAFGIMYILLYAAFARTNIMAMPMDAGSLTNYVWLTQMFLVIYYIWVVDSMALDAIKSGNIAYELTKPISLYKMWFTRNYARRLSIMLLRGGIIFPIIFLLPEPFRFSLPSNMGLFFLFLITLFLSSLLIISYVMIMYALIIKIINPVGVRVTFSLLGDFLTGLLIPIPLMPVYFINIIKWSPFYYMQNIPFSIYNNLMSGSEIIFSIFMQLFWLVVLYLIGNALFTKVLKNTAIQGG